MHDYNTTLNVPTSYYSERMNPATLCILVFLTIAIISCMAYPPPSNGYKYMDSEVRDISLTPLRDMRCILYILYLI